MDFRSLGLAKAVKSLSSPCRTAGASGEWLCRGDMDVECRLFPRGFNAKPKIVESKNDICEIH